MKSFKFKFCRFYSVFTFLMTLLSLKLVSYFLDHVWIPNGYPQKPSKTVQILSQGYTYDRIYYEGFLELFIGVTVIMLIVIWAVKEKFGFINALLLTPSILILGLLVNHPSDVDDIWFLISVFPFISLYGNNLILNWMMMGQFNLWVRDDSALKTGDSKDKPVVRVTYR